MMQGLQAHNTEPRTQRISTQKNSSQTKVYDIQLFCWVIFKLKFSKLVGHGIALGLLVNHMQLPTILKGKQVHPAKNRNMTV